MKATGSSQTRPPDLTARLILRSNRANVTARAIRLGWRIAARLPVPVADVIASLAGDILYATWGGLRERMRANFARVVGPDRAAMVARRSIRHYCRYVSEFLRFPSLTTDQIDRDVDIVGVEKLRDAMAAGRGVIAVGFHIGNIDLGAATLARFGYPVNVVVEPFEPLALDAIIQDQRRAKGLRLIPLAEAPREGLRSLRRGEVLALLIDRPTPEDGVKARFFGGDIALPAGAALLSLRTGAPIVPCCVFRAGQGRFRAEIADAILPPSGERRDRTDDVQRLTQSIVCALETWVRRHPDQWYPFREMFLESSDL
ncbi:MAG: hypothetical protein EPO26_11795 [Chloroflexota bacterium]|nr:MAG: hypothetical protein EPO26_11795 [Chloroflexota bacterium]